VIDLLRARSMEAFVFEIQQAASVLVVSKAILTDVIHLGWTSVRVDDILLRDQRINNFIYGT